MDMRTLVLKRTNGNRLFWGPLFCDTPKGAVLKWETTNLQIVLFLLASLSSYPERVPSRPYTHIVISSLFSLQHQVNITKEHKLPK